VNRAIRDNTFEKAGQRCTSVRNKCLEADDEVCPAQIRERSPSSFLLHCWEFPGCSEEEGTYRNRKTSLMTTDPSYSSILLDVRAP